jgi:hypothetical protein
MVLAVIIELPTAFNAKVGFQRVLWIIDSSVDHLTVTR